MNIKKLRTFSLILLGLFSISGPSFLSAKPAKPGIIEAQQPDGTTVNIQLFGDFHSRMALSEDGYPLVVDENGFYTFATFDKDGQVVPTKFKDINKVNRNSDVVSFLSTVNKADLSEAVYKASAKSKKIPTRGPGLYSTRFPSKGEHNSIAILVEYPDVSFTIDNPQEFFYRMLNEEGFDDYGATGSAKEYFVQNSHGIFQPSFDVYGPVMLSQPMSYYGENNDRYSHKMIIEACEALDDIVDFSQYDCNNDGFIDNVYVFYAGYGEADGGPANSVWPHSWDISYAEHRKEYFYDGVRLDHYACSNEKQFKTGNPDGIGSFCHEFSHVLGLPDLYNTSYSQSFTPGNWSILDVGSYNNNSRTPPNFSSFDRYALDWIEPEVISKSGLYTLDNLSQTNKAYIMPTENENEFFLFENRQNIGNDFYIPGHGMLVWHIDFNQEVWDDNIVNNNNDHQYVDLVEADNIKTNNTRGGDSFPGTANITSFTCTTQPAFLPWDETPFAFDIYEISEVNNRILFKVENCKGAGIDDITNTDLPSNIKVYGNKVVCISGEAVIYNLTGKIVGKADKNGIILPRGIYLVSTNNEVKKIFVK